MSFKDRLVLGLLTGGTLFVLLGRLAPLFHVGLPLSTLAVAAAALAFRLIRHELPRKARLAAAQSPTGKPISVTDRLWPFRDIRDRLRRHDLCGLMV
jgi:hypothetical protein